jgi:hypothetical protein
MGLAALLWNTAVMLNFERTRSRMVVGVRPVDGLVTPGRSNCRNGSKFRNVSGGSVEVRKALKTQILRSAQDDRNLFS